MKILITGASSFIGKKMASTAIKKGWEVACVIRPGSECKCLWNDCWNVTVLELDMKDYSRLGIKCPGCDVAILLAWNGTRAERRMDETLQDSNYRYNMDAVISLISHGCKRIITAGSQAEYGPCSGMITEDTPCRPNTAYGRWKYQFYIDAIGLCHENGVSLKEPRFFSLYGPGDYENAMVMSMIRTMYAGKPCKLTEGIQLWDYLFLDDAVDAVSRLCYMDCAEGAYNMGSGDTRPLREYVIELRDIIGSSSELLFGAVPYPETGMVSICPDISKAKKELGWMPKTSFREGIRMIQEEMG